MISQEIFRSGETHRVPYTRCASPLDARTRGDRTDLLKEEKKLSYCHSHGGTASEEQSASRTIASKRGQRRRGVETDPPQTLMVGQNPRRSADGTQITETP
ncbi:hypothetical protein MATL_G00206580 [Megalops atlanticus]|uniref:Uncharacterized protein n=1 Tax=Megalops atlanticus TaxID=7932 RepID=A0A9D3T0E5_MEGAT|nr:hypothetical protein MATL_G00206580 [Megalops atlanticus]